MPVFFDFETLIGRRGRPRTFTRFFEIGAVCLRSSRVLSMLVDPVVEWDITDAQSLIMAVYESGMNPKPSIRFWARTLKRKGHPYFLKRYKHYFRRRNDLTPLRYMETTTDLAYAHSLRDVIVNGRETTVRGKNDVFGIHDPFDAILELQSIIKDEGDNTLIAHNGKSFDFHVLRGAISRNFNKMAMFKDVKMVDSIGVFRKAMPEFKTYRQPFLYSTIFGEQYDAHIAIDDARALKRFVAISLEIFEKTEQEQVLIQQLWNAFLKKEDAVNANAILETLCQLQKVPLAKTMIGDFFAEDLAHLPALLEKDKELKNLIGASLNMSNEEKQISFLNNCFIFKKVRNVSNIPSLIKINDEDEKNKMESIDNDKKILDEKLDEILTNKIEKEEKEEKVEKVEKEETELTIDEKIKIAQEKKKQKDLEKQKLKEEKQKLK